MYYLQQIFQIMFDPEYTTASLYDTPRLGDTFVIVSLCALFMSVDAFLQAYLRTYTISMGVLSFGATACTIYLLWVGLAMIFHIGAELMGGQGELPNALGFVGLGMAPLIFTSLLRCVLTVLSIEVYYNDPDMLFAKAGFGLNLIGMAWGTPGIICYFGMKNAEKLHMLKALIVTLILFLAFAALLVLTSNIF